ncbi:hypothetical protein [Frigidibacter sp. MR17.24]|uniref:hypothetical protein n=1 Tax=Frigidibacter sp. MR17.24 TaxID=3127345 RepID=UPI003012CE3E
MTRRPSPALALSPLAFALAMGAYADPGTRALDRDLRAPAEDSAMILEEAVSPAPDAAAIPRA